MQPLPPLAKADSQQRTLPVATVSPIVHSPNTAEAAATPTKESMLKSYTKKLFGGDNNNIDNAGMDNNGMMIAFHR